MKQRRKYTHKSLALAVMSAILFTSCHDFFERNIEDEVVQIVTPSNGNTSSIYLQRISWNAVNGAREYHLRLATPSFSSIKKEVLDTIITATSFQYMLEPNKYQLSIVAQNAGYQSKETVVSFEITESYDLSQQEMNPKQPLNLAATNATTITFVWDNIHGAESYVFEIFDATGKSVCGAFPLSSRTFTIPSSSPKIEQLGEQAYSWRIFAKNEVSSSKATVSRFTIDRTAPAKLVSLAPKDVDTSLVLGVAFKWAKAADKGTPIVDSIFIAKDQNFSSMLAADKCANNSFTFTFPSQSATYYWKVKQLDAAGNATESNTRKLLIIPR